MAELTGWNFLMGAFRYGPQWRRRRRLLHEHVHRNAVARYQKNQEHQALRYVRNVLETPHDYLNHGRHLFGALITRIAYGIDVDKSDVDYLGIAEEAMHNFSMMFQPGKHLVESFPILRFLPSFFPGAQFKRDAAKGYPVVRAMRDVPWAASKEAMCQGKLLPSMASGMLRRISQLAGEVAVEEEEYSKDALAAAFGGGADTMLSTLQCFYLAMASNPDVQERAHAELDAVIGSHRLPTLADKPNLPYLCAMVKECLRWRPVPPLGFLHASVDEDEYRGYRIPAGSAIVNIPWAYVHDEKVYPDPEPFRPERFLKDGKLDPDVQDPSAFVFGYGRRACPGRHFAEATIFVVISTVLQAFKIAPPLDEHGRPVDLLETVKMTVGVISYPEPFECTIKPRSPMIEALIRATSLKSNEEEDEN
ncbi:cytochrome P450 [Lentinus tigrinus ALCF2SS1-7]|uniref:cytochrome P450 n=1 Tax=Lentinus tigrinus ALCF2SS1-7 TaxID=1328758 RepID=UPI001165F8C3|nr:cytochrome P450 [Lentinus tigrinus ALCF2SS1-7]